MRSGTAPSWPFVLSDYSSPLHERKGDMDWSELKRPSPMSIPDRLSVDLERLILDGGLAPGERLPSERELAEQLEVSRVSVREALRELENRGMIDRRPGRGTIVLKPEDRVATTRLGIPKSLQPELRDIMELRAIVEPPIARIAAARATSRDLVQLRELLEAMEGAVTSSQYAELDRAFHQAIAQYSHNPLLVLINAQIAEEIAPSRSERYQTAQRRTVSSTAHRKIYEAIADGDGDSAEAEAKKHVLSISEQIAGSAASSASAEHSGLANNAAQLPVAENHPEK